MKKHEKKDEEYIRRCFRLAEKAKGYTSPNPLVGALVVKNGEVIGEGFHTKAGEPHAEVNALKNCKTDVTGADLYVNLEPCSHKNKRTPPCAPLIIEKKIGRVIISNLDPNPAVNGNGVKMLESAGIKVITNVLEKEGEELNKFFFHYITTGKPYVIIKAAISKDGFISKSPNERTIISGEESSAYTHQLRAECDAIMIGAKTAKVDNPQLNVRHYKGKNPVRVILDGHLTLPENLQLIETAKEQKTIIITSVNSDRNKKNRLSDKGVEIIEFPTYRIKLNELLNALGKKQITSILVEGGANLLTQFVEAQLFNEFHLIESPIMLKQGVKLFEKDLPLEKPILTQKLGKDELRIIKLKQSSSERIKRPRDC